MVDALEIRRRAFGTLETEYVAKAGDRLLDAVKAMFPERARSPRGGGAAVHRLTSAMRAESAAARPSPALSAEVTRALESAVAMAVARAEGMVRADATAYAAPGADAREATPSQRHNAALLRVVASLRDELRPLGVVRADKLASLQAVIDGIVGPLFQACASSLTALLAGMHGMPAKSGAAAEHAGAAPSPYMVAFSRQLSLWHRAVFAPCAEYRAQYWRLRRRLLNLLVRNVVTVRPVGEARRLQLLADLSAAEEALAGLGVSLADAAGPAHARLGAVRHVLFSDLDALTPAEGRPELMRPEYVAYHLFSRAETAELRSPAELLGLSPADFIGWIDSAPAADRRALVVRALDEYAALVAEKGDKEYDPAYVVLRAVVEEWRV